MHARIDMTLAATLLLGMACSGQSQSPQAKEKEENFFLPLDALGDLARLNEVKGVRLEGKCSYRDKEQPTQAFTWIWHSASKWRFEARSPRLPDIVILVNGDTGWLKVGEKSSALKGEAIRAMTDQNIWMGLAELTPLASKEYKLTVVGDSKIKGKPATCVKAAAEGWRDAKLYFDKASRLLVKAEFRGKVILRQRDGKWEVKQDPKVLQAFYFSDYRKTDGLQHWHKVAAQRNGWPTADFEVTQVHFLRKVDEKLFQEP
jgi:hypothetical protein